SLALNGAARSTLYAGADEPEVFRTTDATDTWVLKNGGLPPSFSVAALALDAATPTTVYAGLFGGGVFKTTNAGESWGNVSAGLTDPSIKALAGDPTTAGVVYVGATNGLFKSVNGGTTWADLGLVVDVNGIAIDPGTPTTLYVATGASGVVKSFDGGENWF